jgi:ATP-dependent helicase/nuclease subunit A
MPEPTEEQRAAIDHRRTSVVLSSGAGCGKTQVLTARYVSHLRAGEAAAGQIAAITFTDKAAREMRDRIRREAAALADAKKHLRDLETAPVATIHSFCGAVLRQFAIPAGIDPAFDVLDDVLSANLRAEALTAALHGLLEADPALPGAAALRELVVWYGYPPVVEAVDSLLLEADRSAWSLWLERPPEEIAAEWRGPARRGLLKEWVAYLCAASPKLSRALSVLERLPPCGAAVTAKVRRLLDEVSRLHEAADLRAAVEELCEVAKVQDLRKADKPEGETYEALKDAFKALRDELPKRFDLFAAGDEGVAECARFGQQFLRVAAAADDEYRRRKRRAGALDFRDLLVLARDLVRDNAEVRDALRRRFRFVLLDELQDTDPVQMELVELVCGDGLTAGKLFAVGDHKQSIYRFRGAEVALFTRLTESVPPEGRLSLTRNFRSQPGVIRFVNALFARRLKKYEPLTPVLDPAGDAANVEFLWAVPRPHPPTPLPLGERGASSPPPLGEGPGEGSRDAEDEEKPERHSVAALRNAEADAIARRIVELLADETPRLLGKEKGDPPRRVGRADVALLFRSMTNVATYEAALRRHGIDYYLVGGRAFFAQQEVYDLLNVLRAVENPLDSASLVGALRSPFFNLTDEAVFLLAVHDEGVWAGLRDPERLAALPDDQLPAAERAARFLDAWRAEKDRLPVARLVNRLIADTGYDAALQFEFLGERKLANLWKLVDLARSFDRTGLFGLHEFTARLGDIVSRQPREEEAATVPESADVVKLMSIHQAKGLEFPVVFVPDFAAQRQGDRRPVARWHRGLGCLPKVPAEFDNFEKERPFPPFADDLGRTADQLADWQEDLRVLYVACTRARDLLVLSAGLPAADAPLPANHWTLALEERFDPRTGRCVAPEVADAPPVRIAVVSPADRPPEADADREAAPEVVTPPAYRPLPPMPLPAVVSLSALEAIARGERCPITPQFDTEDDSDLPRFRTPRERVGPVSAAERVLWEVLERWDFADHHGWVQLLADALEEVPDRATRDELRAKLAKFADSHERAALAAAQELHRQVEFLADLGEVSGPPVKLRGLIDFLYRDGAGWHLLAVDLGTAHEDDPWRGRRPGLIIQAWVVSRQFGRWPATAGIYDLATGQPVQLAPRKASLAPAVEHFARALKSAPA